MAQPELAVISTPVVQPAAAAEAPVSAVSWGAIWAGAVSAAAMSVILLLLGSGIGLASITPWPGANVATALGVGAAVWLIVVQWVSSALGGYVAGRLRTKWVGVRTDEVFFRDTAHGLVAWAVATIIVVGLLIWSAGSVLRTGTEAAATVAAGAAEAVDPMAYFTDMLFRSPTAPVDGGVRAETTRILVRDVAMDEFPADDRTYLAQLIATATGLPPAEAEARVNDVITDAQAVAAQAREAAETAADAASMIAFYGFISMLIGAFIACVAAAIGGRQRDDGERVIGV